MIGNAEDSVSFAHSGPSHNLLRPAIAELVSCGPLPLPVSGGGHASAIPTILTLEIQYKKDGLYKIKIAHGRRKHFPFSAS